MASMPLHRLGQHNRVPVAHKAGRYHKTSMIELLRTNDLVRLSWLVALLADAGIEAVVLDAHTSNLEGSIGALPRRLVVASDDAAVARRLLRDAGELGPSAP